MAANTDDDGLLREVDEELRRERMEQLWKRYGNLFIAFSLGIVIAVGGYKAWQYYQQKQAEAAGAEYITALDELTAGKEEAAIARLEKLAAGSHAGGAYVASMRLAGWLAHKGRKDKAIAIYRRVAADTSLELPMRTAARVRHAWLIVDTAPREELAKLLGGLDVPGNPWRSGAREILALAAMREGKHEDARKLLLQLMSDPETPAETRSRVAVLLDVLGGGEAQSGQNAPKERP